MPSSAVETDDLVRTFRARGRAPVIALAGVSLEVARGQLFGLLGPNGAGKTTLIKILVTLLLPSGGRARVAGFDVVGLGPQRSTRVSDLSTGMRQRLNLARGFLTGPAVLFLDEPTVGLDVGAARDLRTYIWPSGPDPVGDAAGGQRRLAIPRGLSASLYLVSGAIFPVGVPGPLQAVARALPLAWWLEALRRLLLPGGARLSFPSVSDGAVLTLLAGTTTAAVAFRLAERRARRLGLLDRDSGF